MLGGQPYRPVSRGSGEAEVIAFERQVAYQAAALRGVSMADDGELPDVECRGYVGGGPPLRQPWTPPDLDDCV